MYEGAMRLILIFLFSFSTFASLKDKLLFEARLSTWMSVNKDVVKEKGIVKGIPSSWVNVLEIRGIGGVKWCLNYKIPFKKQKGSLKLIENNDCSQNLLGDTDFEIKEVSDFKISVVKQHLEFSINKKKGGISPIALGTGKYLSFNNRRIETGSVIGSKFLRDSKDILICHDFDKKCNERVSNKCSQCQYGWFSGAASQCPSRVTKYCGISRCGERNMPACPRGNEHTDIVAMTGCQNGSLSGFCQNGLIIVCENGQLYCR